MKKRRKALILAGGLGTRLRPLTFAIPKPLIPIKEKPIIEHVILLLKKYGFTELMIAVAYRSEFIKLFLGNGKKYGVKIRYLDEKKRLGTAGPLSCMKDHCKLREDETILVINGDILTGLNIDDFLKNHYSRGNNITVGLVKVKQKMSYGVVVMDKNEDIIEIREKPIYTYNVSGGIYLLQAEQITLVPSNRYFTMPQLIVKAKENNKKVGGYFIKEFWLAIEEIAHIEEANKINTFGE
jgi:NDP-sugar pyrophosphorylase family protein